MDIRQHHSDPSGSKGDCSLTERQLQVILLVVNGYSNRDLADALGISEYTAKSHLANIYGKLGAQNRLELVLMAVEQQLV